MYDRKTFESKKFKRALENRIAKEILSYGDKGCVVSLCGPAVETHFGTLKPILRNKSELLFAESNPAIVKKERMKERVEACGDKRIVFRAYDVWDAVRKRYIYREGWKHKHVFFDLDFCATADTLVGQGLLLELKKLARSKLPRRGGFWLSITSCQRGDIDAEWWNLYTNVGRIFLNAKWSIRPPTRIEPYREQGHKGANMVNMLFHFKYDVNKN